MPPSCSTRQVRLLENSPGRKRRPEDSEPSPQGVAGVLFTSADDLDARQRPNDRPALAEAEDEQLRAEVMQAVAASEQRIDSIALESGY